LISTPSTTNGSTAHAEPSVACSAHAASAISARWPPSCPKPARSDGSRQWVYKGFALYTYALEKPHEISGNETYDLTEVNGTEKVIAVDQYVTAGGAAAGIGVGALFWHAVVP